MRNIEDADVAILMVDLKQGISVQDKRIAALVEKRGKGLVIAANKSDLIAKEAVKPVHDWLRASVPYISSVPIVFTSALNNVGVQEVIAAATEVFEQGGKRLANAQLKKELLPVFQAQPPRRGAVVYGVKKKGTRPPTFILQVSDTKAVNEAYLRFAEREIRHRFGFRGYPVRIRVGR